MHCFWNVDRFEIDEETKTNFRKKFKNFDRELEKMEIWYLANPDKRKKKPMRFIANWLIKAMREAENPPTSPLPPPSPIRDYKRENDEFKRKLAQWKKEAGE